AAHAYPSRHRLSEGPHGRRMTLTWRPASTSANATVDRRSLGEGGQPDCNPPRGGPHRQEIRGAPRRRPVTLYYVTITLFDVTQNPFVYGEVVPAAAFADRVVELDRLVRD